MLVKTAALILVVVVVITWLLVIQGALYTILHYTIHVRTDFYSKI